MNTKTDIIEALKGLSLADLKEIEAGRLAAEQAALDRESEGARRRLADAIAECDGLGVLPAKWAETIRDTAGRINPYRALKIPKNPDRPRKVA